MTIMTDESILDSLPELEYHVEVLSRQCSRDLMNQFSVRGAKFATFAELALVNLSQIVGHNSEYSDTMGSKIQSISDCVFALTYANKNELEIRIDVSELRDVIVDVNDAISDLTYTAVTAHYTDFICKAIRSLIDGEIHTALQMVNTAQKMFENTQ